MEDANSPPKRQTKMAELRVKFAVFDLNGDGVLSREEITKILTRNTGGTGRSMNMKMASEFCLMFDFDKIDKDGNGAIDIDEFVEALMPNVTFNIFSEYDRGNTGKVPMEKLTDMLSNLSMKKGHRKHPNFDNVLDTALKDFGIDEAPAVDYQNFFKIARRFSESANAPLLEPNKVETKKKPRASKET